MLLAMLSMLMLMVLSMLMLLLMLMLLPPLVEGCCCCVVMWYSDGDAEACGDDCRCFATTSKNDRRVSRRRRSRKQRVPADYGKRKPTTKNANTTREQETQSSSAGPWATATSAGPWAAAGNYSLEGP